MERVSLTLIAQRADSLAVFLRWALLAWRDVRPLLMGAAAAASEVAQLAAHINQQAGYLTLSADTQQSETLFARSFSTTLGTEHGTVQVEHAAQTMREIHRSISGLSQLVTELSEMSEQQNLSIEQIQQSINSIDHSVHHNVQHVAETLQVAQQQQQANALKQAISLFRLG